MSLMYGPVMAFPQGIAAAITPERPIPRMPPAIMTTHRRRTRPATALPVSLRPSRCVRRLRCSHLFTIWRRQFVHASAADPPPPLPPSMSPELNRWKTRKMRNRLAGT
jgi:hypothetical protein